MERECGVNFSGLVIFIILWRTDRKTAKTINHLHTRTHIYTHMHAHTQERKKEGRKEERKNKRDIQ